MSKIPYIIGGVAVLALGGGAAWYFLRKKQGEATGVPAGAAGGYFWQSPDGSPREAASLTELRQALVATYGEYAGEANVMLPGDKAWRKASTMMSATSIASAPPRMTPPALPPVAPPRYIPASQRELQLMVAPPQSSWVGPYRGPVGLPEGFDPSGLTAIQPYSTYKRSSATSVTPPSTMGHRRRVR